MKQRIIYSLIGLFFCVQLFAQRPATGSTVYHTNLDQFAGTWKAINGSEELTVMLKKVMYHTNENAFINWHEETIFGLFEYKINGQVVAGDLSGFANLGIDGSEAFYVKTYDDLDPGIIEGIFIDRAKNKTGSLVITFLPSTPNQIHVQIRNVEHNTIVIHGIVVKPEVAEEFSMPIDIWLSKQ